MKKLPKPINRKELQKDVKKYEERVFGGVNSLSRFFRRNIVNAWDLDALTDAQSVALVKYLRTASDCTVIFDFKLSQGKSLASRNCPSTKNAA